MRFRCSGRTEVQSQAAAAASVCWEPLPKPATSDAISFKEGGIKQTSTVPRLLKMWSGT